MLTSSNQPMFHNNNGKDGNDSEFNTKSFLIEGLRYWWLYIALIGISIAAAYVYLRYSTPIFKIEATILVKDLKQGNGLTPANALSEIDLFNQSNTIENEVELLKSRTLMEETVKALKLNVRYFIEGEVKKSELFGEDLPFSVEFIPGKSSTNFSKEFVLIPLTGSRFEIKLGDSSFAGTYGQRLRLPFGEVVVRATDNGKTTNREYYIINITTIDNAVAQFKANMSVSPPSKSVSVINLFVDDNLPARGEKFLNTLLLIYNKLNREDKNRIADSTISFIESRLTLVSSELNDVEKNIETFRLQNNLTDISEQGKILLDNYSESEKDLAQQEVQIDILDSLNGYLKSGTNSMRIVPAALVIQEPTFLTLIEKYNQLQLERDRRLQATTSKNPLIQSFNVQIENLRNDILSNLSIIKTGMVIRRNDLKKKANSLVAQRQLLPSKERSFLDFSRQQNIKQELYLFLLTKREETAISKSANIDNTRTIDSAKSDPKPFKPRKQIIILIAILIGLIIPTVSIVLKSLFQNRVSDKNDVVTMSKVPIAGEIGRSKLKEKLIVTGDSRDLVSEQFRAMRTNLDFLESKAVGTGRTILLTSSMSGEGKSFLSMNLASSLAITGKRVVLVEFDLRKPKLSSYWNVSTGEGLTTFLSKDTLPSAIVQRVSEKDELFFISSGPLPPNPVEIISNEKVVELFKYLRNEYDHIIIDAPPVGLVTDAQLLAKYADITLYVVRAQYTFKRQLEILKDLYLNKRFKNIAVIVNDVKVKFGSYNNYAYGGYYSNGKKERFSKVRH